MKKDAIGVRLEDDLVTRSHAGAANEDLISRSNSRAGKDGGASRGLLRLDHGDEGNVTTEET